MWKNRETLAPMAPPRRGKERRACRKRFGFSAARNLENGLIFSSFRA